MKRTSDFLKNLQKISEYPRIHLKQLQPNPGSRKQKRRRGRGHGARKGKTAGRGHKGQGQRSSAMERKFGFEGGNFPSYKLSPQKGFYNRDALYIIPLNLNKIQRWVDMGRIDPDKPITLTVMNESGLATNITGGVKLLSDGSEWFQAKINIEVTRASKLAIQTVEARGGSVLCKFYGKLFLRYLMFPQKFLEIQIPRNPLPRGHLLAYYLDPAKRGYLAITKEGKERLALAGLSRACLNNEGRVVLRPVEEAKVDETEEKGKIDETEEKEEMEKYSQELD